MSTAVSARRKHVNPQFLPNKRKRKPIVLDDPAATHRELKIFLLQQKLVVERSALPNRRAEAHKINVYLTYLRSLENK